MLLNPFGLLPSEITASNLVKVDLDGNMIDPGTTQYGINSAGLAIHSAILGARPDINCVCHVHGKSVVAVSCTHAPHLLRPACDRPGPRCDVNGNTDAQWNPFIPISTPWVQKGLS